MNVFTPADAGPRILLLDLMSTLSANFREMGPNPSAERIRDKERYRPYLVDWLRQVQQAGWEVHLFTVRTRDRQHATLKSIQEKTGWKPDKFWFKGTEAGDPPAVKAAYLDRLIPDRNPSALYAFESNAHTRGMFKERRIPCRPIREPDDLPPLAEFVE